MPINIHGKSYVTVAERLEMAKGDILQITSDVVPSETHVVVKSTVVLKGLALGDEPRIFTGISAANPGKAIEKMSPYEVAETSAIGRALGFAGYGATDGIASADEMVKAGAVKAFKKSEPINTDEAPF